MTLLHVKLVMCAAAICCAALWTITVINMLDIVGINSPLEHAAVIGLCAAGSALYLTGLLCKSSEYDWFFD